MKRINKYNLSVLFRKAWSLYRKASKKATATFADALRTAWAWMKVQASNAAKVEATAAAAGYGDMICRTWYGWKSIGREVMHTEKAVFQVEIADPTTHKGTRIESYFTYEQTFKPMAA